MALLRWRSQWDPMSQHVQYQAPERIRPSANVANKAADLWHVERSAHSFTCYSIDDINSTCASPAYLQTWCHVLSHSVMTAGERLDVISLIDWWGLLLNCQLQSEPTLGPWQRARDDVLLPTALSVRPSLLFVKIEAYDMRIYRVHRVAGRAALSAELVWRPLFYLRLF